MAVREGWLGPLLYSDISCLFGQGNFILFYQGIVSELSDVIHVQ